MKDFIKENYHTHTTRCQHAYGTEREYIEAAIDMGMHKLGFSDHIPCPFENGYVSGIRMTMEQAEEYRECIRQLAEEYRSQIQIYCGFEAEYIPEFYEKQIKMMDELGFDYMIMGQHFWGDEQKGPYAGTPTREESAIRRYVDSVIEGMKTGSYKYLAHPDLIHFQGGEQIYQREMLRLCQALKEMQIPLEMNVLGMGEKKHYPNKNFWKLAAQTGNAVIFGMDAHCVAHLTDQKSYLKCKKLAEQYALSLLSALEM